MICQRYLFFLLLVLTLPFCLQALPGDTSAETHVTILEQTDLFTKLRIQFDPPEMKPDGAQNVALYKNAQLTVAKDGAVVPLITRLVPLPYKQARLVVNGSTFNQMPVTDYFSAGQPGDGHPMAELTYQGRYRDAYLHALKLRPVRLNADKTELSYLSMIELEIRSMDAKALSKPGTITRRMDELAPGLLDGSMSTVAAAEPDEISQAQLNRLPLQHDIVFKLTVGETGLYKVTFDELDEAEFPLTDIDPRKLRLFNKGKEIPVYFKGAEDGVFDPVDFFEFWGERNEKTFIDRFPDMHDDPFSDENAYWLVVSDKNGERLVEESGGLRETQPGQYRTPFSYTETLHFEKNAYFAILGRMDSKLHRPAYETDHWFFDKGVSAVGSETYDFDLPYPVDYGSQVFVKAMFRGASYEAPANPLEGHQVELWLNDQKVGETLPQDGWMDQEYAVIDNYGGTGIAQSNLRHGTNELRVQMDQAGVTDIVMLNWFEVSYQREYRADDDFIRFRLQDNFPTDRIIQFEVRGFSSTDIQIYKLGVSKMINATIEFSLDDTRQPNTYKLKIQDQIIDRSAEYVALSETSKKSVRAIEAYTPWKSNAPERDILQSANSADYLIITHALFATTSQELKSLKEAQGFDVEIVTVDQIYDLFNYGNKSPVAVKKFIEHVYFNWRQESPLKYVVLVGDASYDHKDYKNTGSDLVPTMMYETYNYGAAASDYWFSLVSGDDLIPDLIVSRIPVRTNQQLLDYIAKVDQYQNNTQPGAWRNNTLFISGNDDPSKSGNLENITDQPVFRAQSLRLINLQLPESLFAFRLNTVRDTTYPGGFDPEFGGKTDLIDYFNDGLSFINFLGHGGGGIWADVNLLDLDDVDRLNNDSQYPFVASMTCFTGAFENPGKDGLAERLLLAPNRGAIAVLASSGLGWMQNDYTIEWGLFDYLWKDDLSFGEAVNLMKIFYMINPVYITDEKSFFTWGYNSLVPSMVSQYNLVGDPALVMQKTSGKLDVRLSSYTPFPGENVAVSVNTTIQNASGRIVITDQMNRELVSSLISSSENPVYEFTIPDDAEGKIYRIKLYLNDGQNDYSGVVEAAVSQSLIKNVRFTPEEPDVNQPIDVEIVAKSSEPISSIRCINFKAFNTTRAFDFEVPMTNVNDTLFRSTEPIPGFQRDGLKYFEIEVKTETDSVYTFFWRELRIGDSRPDLVIDENSVQYGGNNLLNLEFTLLNDSDQPVENIQVQAIEIDTADNETKVFEDTITLLENGEKNIIFPVPSPGLPEFRKFRLIADATDELEERDESNNTVETTLLTDRLLIKRDIGTSYNGATNDTLLLNDKWSLHIAPQGLTASSVLRYEGRDIRLNLARGKQKDLKFVPVVGQYDTTALVLDLKNNETGYSKPAMLSVHIDRSNFDTPTLDATAFFKYDSYLGLWVTLPSSWSENQLTTQITSDGLYGVFSFNDDEQPAIEITVDGRPLLPDMLVTSNPAMAFLLQDANGINLTGSFELFIDGEELSEAEMTYPDSIRNANTISILTTPELEKGDHSLQVQVQDISGNLTERFINFTVSGEFDIRVYGNYPNPFQDETIISYFISSNTPIDEFSIKIYSTSGRLVRSEPLIFDESITDDLITAPNYHELIWDGTDDDGNMVANGVYFAVIKGKFEGKTVEHTIKMAKLK